MVVSGGMRLPSEATIAATGADSSTKRAFLARIRDLVPAQVLIPWLASRAIVLIVALAASEQAPNRERPLVAQTVLERLLSTLMRWDGGWYSAIVQRGYTAADGSASSAVAFFPLYPLTVRALCWATGLPDPLVAVLFSNVCALLAGLVLFRLIQRQVSTEVATWSVLFLLFAPSAIHFSAYYTESLFLLLCVGSYLAASQRRWLLVALLGALVTATRPTGFLLIGALALNIWQDRGYQLRPIRELVAPSAALAFSSVGALAYAGYLVHTFGGLDVYFVAQSTEWPRRFHPATFFSMLFDVQRLMEVSVETLLQGFVPTVLALIGTVWLLHLRRFGDALFVFGSVFLAVGGGTFESTQRYLVTLFPLCRLLASVESVVTRACLLALSATLMGYWAALFGGGWHFT
jgi:hypothetical protein